MATSKFRLGYRQLRAKLGLPPRPRRAKRPPIMKSVTFFVLSAIGFLGILAASAVLLPPRIETYEATPDYSIESPVESPTSLITASPAPRRHPTKTPSKRVLPPKPAKPTPAPKIVGVRYACAPLNVRVEPGRKTKIVDQVDPRTKIRIMNRVSGDWRMVRFEKKNRWMYSPCLWKSPPPKPKPTPKPEPPKQSASPTPKTSTNSVWDKLAQCESGQRWSYNGSSGFDGGLQFLPSTWTAYGGGKYAKYAWQATREEQIAIAKKVLAAAGWGSWPACSSKLGLR